jgi:hypothetical protein
VRRVNIKSSGPVRANIEKIELEENGELIDIRQDVLSATVNLKPNGTNTISLEFIAGEVESHGLHVLGTDSRPPESVPGVFPTEYPEFTPTGQGSGD